MPDDAPTERRRRTRRTFAGLSCCSRPSRPAGREPQEGVPPGTPPRKPTHRRRISAGLPWRTSSSRRCTCGDGCAAPLPGRLQLRGSYGYQMADADEAARDFARAFAGCMGGKGDIMLLTVSDAEAAPPRPVVCAASAGGDVNQRSVSAATDAFRAQVLAPALAAAGAAALAPALLGELSERLIGNLSVGAAMEALTQHGCAPAMHQNKFLLLVGQDSVRVLTYGYIGEPVSGDRPDTKHTPFTLRLLTENLLSPPLEPEAEPESDGSGGGARGMTISYAVAGTGRGSMVDEVQRDAQRLHAAIASGEWEPVLRRCGCEEAGPMPGSVSSVVTDGSGEG